MQDITERREIEQQLIQAQKMEAIGNLTGGMAHDFNNLLGVISGNLFLLAEAVQGDAEQEELCRDALEAANRGAELTRRLLAFGRRQSLRPQATDINLLVAETTKLLTRVLGEDVSVELRLAKALRPTVVDPAQLEAAITNLVNNARDAMPKGGRLTIATSAAHLDANDAAVHPDAVPGDYNIIEVTDTGTGMPPEIKARIFDPFFTTKPQGKGTGLGLSMVFGFVRQSNGHVSVRSEPGHGTTVRLYLPYRVDSSVPIAVAPQREIVGGDEAILLVEDDVAMRRIAAKQLAELGYAVTEAETPAAALEMLDRGAVFDLLLTDVVMPGEMDGLDLATAAQRRWGLKTLLMSGFPEARFAQRAEGEIRPRLISKPFQRNLLAAVLRELLDAPPQAEAPRRPAVFAAAD
jgi:nitrogen-specific signal transduction histidine kinase/CheY-like chemotaxis protein